ncbi:MAG TPA: peptide ABC transporter substrate-binding protein [Clostridia bacterium]|nr:peptide ABC transporter substrate-binding protein [Clostridia bacterium]
MKYGRLFLVIILLVSLLSVSCEKVVEPDKTEITIENETPVAGGTINMSSVEPGSLNPLLSRSKTYNDISELVFQSLMEYDANLKLVPVLAQGWSFEDGSSRCVIKLKENILWSDGEKFTAEDVKFSLDTIKASENSIYKSNLEHIFSYKVKDGSTIEVMFDQPFANAIDMLSFPIIPEHIYKQDINAVPVGTGMFKVSQYDKLKSMELVYNDRWQGAEKPYIEKIKVLFINDTEAFSTAFQYKELDILNTTSYDWEKYSEMKDVNAYRYSTMYYDFIGLNYNKSIFQDKAVRKAMIQGINRKSLVDKYLLGNAVVTDMPINPGSWLNSGENEKYAYSRSEAQNVLKAAGFTDSNGDGLLERQVDGAVQELRFTLMTNNENEFRSKAAEDIKKSLEEIGFRVEIKSGTFEEVKAAIDAKAFDAVLTGYNLSNTQDLSFAFHSTQIKSGKNFMSYSNPDIDAILQQAYTAIDEGQRKEMYKSLEKAFREEVPCISLFFRDAAVVVRDKIKGEIKPDSVNPYRNIHQWFIPESKQQQIDEGKTLLK